MRTYEPPRPSSTHQLGEIVMFGYIERTLKKRLTKGLSRALGRVRMELRLRHRHRSNLARARSLAAERPIKLNLGSGPNRKAGWINVDLFSDSADAQLDLREPWPFSEGSASHVYSEHVFEHFEIHDDAPHFLAESFRVLEAGGIFDVGVPDTEWPLRAYGDPSNEYWSLAKRLWHPSWCQTQLEHLNYHFRQDGEHQYAWDQVTLKGALERAGFVQVAVREFEADLDAVSRRIGTLYMRGHKPR